MSRRAAAAALLLALACLVFGYQAGKAAGPASRPTPTFTPVRIPAAPSKESAPLDPASVPAPATREVGPGGASMPGTILDPAPSRSLTPRVVVEQPSPELRIVEKPVVVAPRSGVSGSASWYDDPRKAGLYAAAGPALRVGDWRGRTVTVCEAVCFPVVLSDFCGCPGGRVIDLSGNAFARLAPLSQGVVNVTVTW